MCLYIFFIHSSVNGHLGCFHVLTIGNWIDFFFKGTKAVEQRKESFNKCC